MFKTVSLDEKTWRGLCALINASPNEDDHQFSQMIREQIDGDLKVTITRGSVSFKAKKGGDVRDSLSMPRPDVADAQVTHVNGKCVPGDVAKIAAMVSLPDTSSAQAAK